MKPYVVLEKRVGETPLQRAEKWRAENSQYADVPLAYAGRLDPMASGKLIILIGDECKKQSEYHGLDKAYDFSILFGVSSDTGDVLGIIQPSETNTNVNISKLEQVAGELIGPITLPYPHFSSKTVRGKPLHTWTLEGRLDEIEIPVVTSTIYKLDLKSLSEKSRQDVADEALTKIETVPPVTDERKAIGNDFRRVDVRQDWQEFKKRDKLPETYNIATFSCVASSGTYMRSLAELIAKKVGAVGLAWHIHRTNIGRYDQSTNNWQEEF
jgi:tRNA pseudouridine(55) synthase